MHRHFRIIAISEYLRCRGYDPDVYPHTRIPGIWNELRNEYDLDAINERDNSLDYVEDPDYDQRFKEFSLPLSQFSEAMVARAIADPESAASSPPQWDPDGSAGLPAAKPSAPKRKRGDTATRTRSSTVESSDAQSSQRSPSGPQSTKGTRSQKKAASKAKAPSSEPEAEPEEEEEEGDDDDEGEDEENEAVPSKTARGSTAARSKQRGRNRARGRSRGR